MAVLPIRQVPDPVLRQRAKRITSFDGSVQRLIDNMIDTLHSAGGVGLAANQVGVPLRLVVIHLPETEVVCLVNPEIVKRSGEREVVEGCLSIPGYQGELKRSERVVVKGHDRWGREVRLRAEELMAQALEHEIDHLNGILYIDRVEGPDKLTRIKPEAEAEPGM
ncbi:MAG TPA: peptide deformylase [Dehalococcoidia bacterium]|nr:peptide deformylase [Dehalococcoidia bacterium]